MSDTDKESKARSFLKAVSWRIIATTTTFFLALFIFQDDEKAIEKSTIVASLELVINLLCTIYTNEDGKNYQLDRLENYWENNYTNNS